MSSSSCWRSSTSASCRSSRIASICSTFKHLCSCNNTTRRPQKTRLAYDQLTNPELARVYMQPIRTSGDSSTDDAVDETEIVEPRDTGRWELAVVGRLPPPVPGRMGIPSIGDNPLLLVRGETSSDIRGVDEHRWNCSSDVPFASFNTYLSSSFSFDDLTIATRSALDRTSRASSLSFSSKSDRPGGSGTRWRFISASYRAITQAHGVNTTCSSTEEEGI